MPRIQDTDRFQDEVKGDNEQWQELRVVLSQEDKRRKKILNRAEGYFGSKHLLFKTAKEASSP